MPSDQDAPFGYLAPQARLVDMANETEVASTTTSDLVSVQVTQVNTGPAQLAVSLNNQAEAPDAQRTTSPFFPPWKYNDLSKFKPGQRIRVDLRYGGGTWQTVIVARITGMSFSFPGAGGAQLSLQGEDLLSLLKNSSDTDKNYRRLKEKAIVEDVIDRSQSGLRKSVVEPAGVTEPLRSLIHEKRTPYLQFIQGIADRLDYEIWVDDSALTSGGVSSSGGSFTFHFEPARSLTAPSSPMMLRRGGGDQETVLNLIDFNARMQVADQFNSVNAGGGNPNNRGALHELVGQSEIQRDLHGDRALDAATVRDRFFLREGGEATRPMTVNVSNLDAARARLKAAADLRKKARELLTVEGSAVGHPRLRAGIHVQVDGMRPPFDGIYYVTKAVHTLDAGGYKTQFSLRRPGITDPAGYLGAA